MNGIHVFTRSYDLQCTQFCSYEMGSIALNVNVLKSWAIFSLSSHIPNRSNNLYVAVLQSILFTVLEKFQKTWAKKRCNVGVFEKFLCPAVYIRHHSHIEGETLVYAGSQIEEFVECVETQNVNSIQLMLICAILLESWIEAKGLAAFLVYKSILIFYFTRQYSTLN